MFDISTTTIWFLLIEVSHSDRNIFQLWAVYSRYHTGKTFGCLKKMDSFRNSAIFFTLVIEKVGLYTNIAIKNIGYSKLS